MKSDLVVEFKNVTKVFGNLVANNNVSLKVKRGSIHALIGENGAGKTTLMNQLFGLMSPTAGHILVNGKKVFITNPNLASELGLAMVHQHFQLVANHSILENIILANTISKSVAPIDYQKAKSKLIQVSNKYNLQIDPAMIVKKVSVGTQQRIEILKMLYKGAEILIFDEPTAMLTPIEIDGLLKLFLDLKTRGKTIIFISHKLREVKQVADTATVIRKGRVVRSFALKDVPISKIAEMMVGRKLVAIKNQSLQKPGRMVLSIQNITIASGGEKKVIGLKDFSLDVHAGEIVAIAGVEGNGQLELVNGIFGLQKCLKGKILVRTTNEKTQLSEMRVLKNGSVKFRYGTKFQATFVGLRFKATLVGFKV